MACLRTPRPRMQLLSFALGLFVFIGLTLFILKYTTYLSNLKKDTER
ncbi:hypothetical protein [Alicyclobacillus pomorum]|nr:hypothetical protein [Alicyclobacillus pomorum]